MKRLVRSALAAALISSAALIAAPAVSQAVTGAPAGAFAATTLNLSASGETNLAPDMATIILGVDTTESTAVKAMAANAARMSRVVAALKAAGLSGRALQTSNISLSPQYVYDQSQPPRLTGYQASNQVTVTVSDLARLGDVVDAVVSAGATNVGQIAFGLTNPLAAENSARVAAVKALTDKAALYAEATGYRVSRLVNLREGGGAQPEPLRAMPMMAMQKSAAPTLVEAGEVKVTVEISGVYELTR